MLETERNCEQTAIPFLDVLDFPVPTSCAPARCATNTPLQSLSLLNDRFDIEQGDRFAVRHSSGRPA
jgi:hypothetical protein